MHENALISFKHEYRRLILSSRCDVISDVIIMKIFFTHNLHMVFSFLISNWSYIEYVKFLQSDKILRSVRTFSSKVSPEVCYINRIAKGTHYILSY